MANGKRRRRQTQEGLGTCEFKCPHCGHRFNVSWQFIFDLQETTHGYVGWETQEEFIACPKCGGNANAE